MPTPLAGKHKSQADYRRSYTNVDQFGRPWAIIIEKETGDPIMVAPAGWDDPLRTPPKYLSVPTEVRGEISILWKIWLIDAENAQHRHKRLRDRWGRAAFGTAYDPAQPHPDAVYAAGDPPLSPSKIRKAMEGDDELLGMASVRAIADRHLTAVAAGQSADGDLARKFRDLEAKVARMERAASADELSSDVEVTVPDKDLEADGDAEDDYQSFLDSGPSWVKFNAWHAKRGKGMDEIRNLWEDQKQALALAGSAEGS